MFNYRNIIITEVSSYPLFLAGYQNSHSYRIPSLLKLKSEKLIAIVDQRLESQLDAPYTSINQVLRSSNDKGLTWSDAKTIIYLEKTRISKASAIDSVIVQDPQSQTIYLAVDVYPGGAGLMPLAKELNPLGGSDLGFTPDRKYKKLYKLNSADKMVLVPLLSNCHYFQAHLLLDGDWHNTTPSNLQALPVFVNNSFDSQTGVLHGGVYENIHDVNEFKNTLPVCSIFDGFHNKNPNYVKPQYYLEATAYLYLFKSDDDAETWELVKEITHEVNKNNPSINSLVLGPGQGLVLQKQKNPENNGRIIFPFYEVNYALPQHAFVSFSDDQGQTWHSSNYINPKPNACDEDWHWLSETQLVENNDGTIWAYCRNPYENQYCVARSEDAGLTWKGSNCESLGYSCFFHTPLNAEVMHGLTAVFLNGHDYHLLSLPTTKDRKCGKLFLIDKKQKLEVLANLNPNNESFGYSTMQVISLNQNILEIGLLYETNQVRNQGLIWMGFDDPKNVSVSVASEIIFKKIRITFPQQ